MSASQVTSAVITLGDGGWGHVEGFVNALQVRRARQPSTERCSMILNNCFSCYSSLPWSVTPLSFILSMKFLNCLCSVLVCITWYKSLQVLHFHSQILFLHTCHIQNEAVAHGYVFGGEYGNTIAILCPLWWMIIITWHSAGSRSSNQLRAETPNRGTCPLALWMLFMLCSFCWTIQSTSILVT